MRLKKIKAIVEKTQFGKKYNEILEFETKKKFDNWYNNNKNRGKL